MRSIKPELLQVQIHTPQPHSGRENICLANYCEELLNLDDIWKCNKQQIQPKSTYPNLPQHTTNININFALIYCDVHVNLYANPWRHKSDEKRFDNVYGLGGRVIVFVVGGDHVLGIVGPSNEVSL